MEKAETHPPPPHPLNTKVRFLTPLPPLCPSEAFTSFQKTPRGSNASPYAGADTRPDRNADVVSDRYADTRPDRNAESHRRSAFRSFSDVWDVSVCSNTHQRNGPPCCAPLRGPQLHRVLYRLKLELRTSIEPDPPLSPSCPPPSSFLSSPFLLPSLPFLQACYSQFRQSDFLDSNDLFL